MITFLLQGSFILISSDSGQHVRQPSLFYPSLNCAPWFIQLGLCSAVGGAVGKEEMADTGPVKLQMVDPAQKAQKASSGVDM